MRDRLDRVYDNYYNYVPEDGLDNAAARKPTPQSVTIGIFSCRPPTVLLFASHCEDCSDRLQCGTGGENFGATVKKVSRSFSVRLKPVLSIFSKGSKVANFNDQDFVHQDGHLYVPAITLTVVPACLRDTGTHIASLVQAHITDSHILFTPCVPQTHLGDCTAQGKA